MKKTMILIVYPCSTHSLNKTHISNQSNKPKDSQVSVHMIKTKKYYLPLHAQNTNHCEVIIRHCLRS